MNEQYYLRILENGEFITLLEGYNEILETDIPIKTEDYIEYLNTKDVIKYYKLKEVPTGEELFDYIEEYTPEVIRDTTPTDKDRIKALEMALLEVL